MADLTEIESSQSVKIMGSSSDGTEQTPVKSNGSGKLMSANISDDGGTEGALIVGIAAIEAKVGAAVLVDRVTLTVYNNSNSVIYYGYTNGVTILSGTPILKKQLAVFDVGPGTTVYLISASAGNDTRVTENA